MKLLNMLSSIAVGAMMYTGCASTPRDFKTQALVMNNTSYQPIEMDTPEMKTEIIKGVFESLKTEAESNPDAKRTLRKWGAELSNPEEFGPSDLSRFSHRADGKLRLDGTYTFRNGNPDSEISATIVIDYASDVVRLVTETGTVARANFGETLKRLNLSSYKVAVNDEPELPTTQLTGTSTQTTHFVPTTESSTVTGKRISSQDLVKVDGEVATTDDYLVDLLVEAHRDDCPTDRSVRGDHEVAFPANGDYHVWNVASSTTGESRVVSPVASSTVAGETPDIDGLVLSLAGSSTTAYVPTGCKAEPSDNPADGVIPIGRLEVKTSGGGGVIVPGGYKFRFVPDGKAREGETLYDNIDDALEGTLKERGFTFSAGAGAMLTSKGYGPVLSLGVGMGDWTLGPYFQHVGSSETITADPVVDIDDASGVETEQNIATTENRYVNTVGIAMNYNLGNWKLQGGLGVNFHGGLDDVVTETIWSNEHGLLGDPKTTEDEEKNGSGVGANAILGVGYKLFEVGDASVYGSILGTAGVGKENFYGAGINLNIDFE